MAWCERAFLRLCITINHVPRGSVEWVNADGGCLSKLRQRLASVPLTWSHEWYKSTLVMNGSSVILLASMAPSRWWTGGVGSRMCEPGLRIAFLTWTGFCWILKGFTLR